jgi:L-alanine-DL-glutamate epimerase-like enolase superfamily enzyme
MRISHCEIYGYTLSYAHGEYVMSGGRAAQVQQSTLVRLATDAGAEGWGEVAPLSGTYLPNFVGGIRAALQELAPALIGADPTNLSLVHRIMDATLLGQQAAKSALDVACWDLLGQRSGLPVAVLLGGVLQADFPLYEAVPLGSPDSMAAFAEKRAAAGITAFQVKVGNRPREDAARVGGVVAATDGKALIVADANGGWTLQDGLIAARMMDDHDIFLEQPCRSLDDCALVGAACRLPLVLDEVIVTAADLVSGKSVAGAGSVNIKLGRVGGLSRAARMRDLAQDLGVSVTVEDMWGGDVTTAAVSHLAASTRPELMLSTCFFNDWTNEHVAVDPPRSKAGRGAAPTGPGLGITIDRTTLGPPLFSAN